MTQEEKDLLLKDLCARWSYGVKVRINSKPRKVIGIYDKYVVVKGKTDGKTSWDNYGIEEYNIKPYLRTMSSMTKEEYEELKSVEPYYGLAPFEFIGDWGPNFEVLDWLNKHHFDYRGLIEKGLANEAPEGMYNTKTD